MLDGSAHEHFLRKMSIEWLAERIQRPSQLVWLVHRGVFLPLYNKQIHPRVPVYTALKKRLHAADACQSRVRSEDGRVARIGRIPYNAVDYQ